LGFESFIYKKKFCVKKRARTWGKGEGCLQRVFSTFGNFMGKRKEKNRGKRVGRAN